MNKIAVVVDSGIDLPKEYKKDNVFILPLKVIKDGVIYLDGVTITPQEVVAEIADHDFKTSLISPGEVTDYLEKVKMQGYQQVIMVTISSGLSGTYSAFVQAADSFDELEVEVIDTLSIGSGAGLHAVEAIDLIESGKSLKETADILRDKVNKSKVYFLVGTLDYLIKGGRINKVTGFVGQALSLKPVITCDEEGKYVTVVKVRSHMQGINQVLDLIEAQFGKYKAIDVAVADCSRPKEVEYINQQLKERLSNIRTLFNGTISPALTVHTGPDLIGITAYLKED
jgi:DegV family protein with EDD domain